MALIRYLLRVLRAIFGLPDSRALRAQLTLVPRSARRLTLAKGELSPNLVKVAVYQGVELTPATGARVRFTVLSGIATLGTDATAFTAVTGSDGVAATPVRLNAIGSAVISAALDDGSAPTTSFRVQTEQTVYSIELWAEPAVAADPGVIAVRAAAFDFRDQPVTDARLVIQANTGLDTVIQGNVVEVENGAYAAELSTHLAAEWHIVVQDPTTGARAVRCVHVLPDRPQRFALGDTQPRSGHPRGELSLEVRLVDKFGNGLDPSRIVFESDAGTSTRLLHGDAARFTIAFPGYGVVPIRLRDAQSDVTHEQDIRFDAVGLDDPGLVLVDERYRIPVYGFLQPGRPTATARIEIRFDAETARFVGIERSHPNEFTLTVAPTLVDPDLLSLSIVAQRVVAAEEIPNGLYICDTIWECTGEGETCFEPVAYMSPSHPGMKLCVTQKRDNPKTLCVNIIHPTGDAAAKAAGDTGADAIQHVFDLRANVARCCPAVTVTRHYCAIPAANMAQIVTATGDGIISTVDEFSAVAAMTFCTRPNCYNLWMLPFDDPGVGGRTNAVGQDPSILDPATVTTDPTTAAHELGHALGLDDITDPIKARRRVMKWQVPVGTQFSEDECDTIWSNIDRYGG